MTTYNSRSGPRRFQTIDLTKDVTFSDAPNALKIVGDGWLNLQGSDGVQCRFKVQDGEYLIVSPVAIVASGTTISGVIALF